MYRMKGRRRHKTIKTEIDIDKKWKWNYLDVIPNFLFLNTKEILVEFEIFFGTFRRI